MKTRYLVTTGIVAHNVEAGPHFSRLAVAGKTGDHASKSLQAMSGILTAAVISTVLWTAIIALVA